MVYAVVTDIGVIDMFTSCLMEAVNRLEELKNDYDIEGIILDDEPSIEDAMFNTDGLNDAWFDDYYEWFPHDAGIDIKIPIHIFIRYFNKAIDGFASLEADVLYNMMDNSGYTLTDDEVDERVDQVLMTQLNCSSFVWDKIMHGEYMVV